MKAKDKKSIKKTKLGTAQQKQTFLTLYEKHRSITKACRAMHINPATAYRAIKLDEELRMSIQLINEFTADKLEEILLDRIENGTAKGIYWQGEQVAEERQYDSKLLLAALKAFRPRRYNPIVVARDLEKEPDGKKEVDISDVKRKLLQQLEMMKDKEEKDNRTKPIEGEFEEV